MAQLCMVLGIGANIAHRVVGPAVAMEIRGGDRRPAAHSSGSKTRSVSPVLKAQALAIGRNTSRCPISSVSSRSGYVSLAAAKPAISTPGFVAGRQSQSLCEPLRAVIETAGALPHRECYELSFCANSWVPRQAAGE
jgi:hypothetical protein